MSDNTVSTPFHSLLTARLAQLELSPADFASLMVTEMGCTTTSADAESWCSGATRPERWRLHPICDLLGVFTEEKERWTEALTRPAWRDIGDPNMVRGALLVLLIADPDPAGLLDVILGARPQYIPEVEETLARIAHREREAAENRTHERHRVSKADEYRRKTAADAVQWQAALDAGGSEVIRDWLAAAESLPYDSEPEASVWQLASDGIFEHYWRYPGDALLDHAKLVAGAFTDANEAAESGYEPPSNREEWIALLERSFGRPQLCRVVGPRRGIEMLLRLAGGEK